MNIRLGLGQNINNVHIKIAGSKSETNRLLLLQALSPEIKLHNVSDSDDSSVMQEALAAHDGEINVHHSGTAMRFLTAYFAMKEGREVVLTGSERMKDRPIGILVSALKELGAEIEYLEKDGFPPLMIRGKKLTGGKISLRANMSSQFITALLLIGGKLEHGIEIKLEGEITSRPYIDMTLALLTKAGIANSFIDNKITIYPKSHIKSKEADITIESDWSSASYFYSIAALSVPGTTISLSSFRKNSFQGDSALVNIYKKLGVITDFQEDILILSKTEFKANALNIDLQDTPDIAQTLAVTCLGLGIECRLTGLHTLKIKETDRLLALKAELEKFGAEVTITLDSLTLKPCNHINEHVAVDTYNDHRMAMAFAPLAVKTPVVIKDSAVVSKSYPAFWRDMEHLGFTVSEQL